MTSGCIAATARLHAGPTVSSDGEVDVQAGIAFGFGYAVSDESAVTGALGVSTGTRNSLDLTDTIEYVSMPEDALGKRGGITAQVPLLGEHVGMYVHTGVMYPLRYRSRSGGHEKMFSTSTTTVLAVGARARAGLMGRTEEVDGMARRDGDLMFAAGGDITLDWWMFSRVR
jgi:hypothetical protein